MKLKGLKELLNSLSDEQLERPLIYNSEEYSLSGEVVSVEKTKADLFYTGEDDPAPLYTKKQLRDQGLDFEEISELEVEIPKGAIVIKF